MKSFLLESEEDFKQFAARNAACFVSSEKTGCMVYLQGNLGAGKTTFVRSLLQSIGYLGKVKSPTYTLIEPYEVNGISIVHMDLYRMAGPEELEWLGLRDLLTDQTICFVEWPEMGRGFLPDADILIEILHEEDARQLKLVANSPVGKKIVKNIQ